LVRTGLGERVVQKHRIETLNKNRDVLREEWSFFVLARWCTNFVTKTTCRQNAWCGWVKRTKVFHCNWLKDVLWLLTTI